jgi:hypothetical protein
MTHATGCAVGQEAALREQLASFRPLLALSMVMTSSRDETEILRIATTAVPSLGGCQVGAVYLDGGWQVVGPVGRPANADVLGAQLAALDRSGGRWTWTVPVGPGRSPWSIKPTWPAIW